MILSTRFGRFPFRRTNSLGDESSISEIQVDSCGDRQCTSGWLSENPRRRSLLCETVSMKSSPDVLSIPDQYGSERQYSDIFPNQVTR